MAKHTPGPWIVKKVPTSLGVCFRIGPPEMANAKHGGICAYDDRTGLNPQQEGEQEANAYLAAASPQMKDALEAWRHWDYEVSSAQVNGESIYTHRDFADMRKKALLLMDAALAAAKGEVQF